MINSVQSNYPEKLTRFCLQLFAISPSFGVVFALSKPSSVPSDDDDGYFLLLASSLSSFVNLFINGFHAKYSCESALNLLISD